MSWPPTGVDSTSRVVHRHPARADCPERHLGRPRHPQFADDQHIEWPVQRRRDPGRHRHTAAHQPEHDDVGPVGVGGELAGEDRRRRAPDWRTSHLSVYANTPESVASVQKLRRGGSVHNRYRRRRA